MRWFAGLSDVRFKQNEQRNPIRALAAQYDSTAVFPRTGYGSVIKEQQVTGLQC